MSAIYKNYTKESGKEVDRLFQLPFKECAIYIGNMDTMKKAEVAAEIQPILDSLYATADRYGNKDYPIEDQIGPDMFVHIMGRIKRWETIIYWLFEMDILMGETELDKQVRAAEKKMEEIDWNQHLTKVKILPNVEGIVGKSGKVTKTIKVETTYAKEYRDLVDKREARGVHTDAIIEEANLMAEAATLAKRFFR